MNGIEIRSKIDENNKIIQQLLNKFILNNDLKKLMDENEQLRKECPHNFVDGVCEYCDVLEEYLID